MTCSSHQTHIQIWVSSMITELGTGLAPCTIGDRLCSHQACQKATVGHRPTHMACLPYPYRHPQPHPQISLPPSRPPATPLAPSPHLPCVVGRRQVGAAAADRHAVHVLPVPWRSGPASVGARGGGVEGGPPHAATPILLPPPQSYVPTPRPPAPHATHTSSSSRTSCSFAPTPAPPLGAPLTPPTWAPGTSAPRRQAPAGPAAPAPRPRPHSRRPRRRRPRLLLLLHSEARSRRRPPLRPTATAAWRSGRCRGSGHRGGRRGRPVWGGGIGRAGACGLKLST